MAIANLQETLLFYTHRKNAIQVEIMSNQARKTLALAQISDTNSLLAANKASIRAKWEKLYKENPDEYGEYKDYTEIPDFEKEIDEMTAKIQDELDELTAWETQIDNEQTQLSAEDKEIDAYKDSLKAMLQANVSDDFNFSGIGGA